MLTQRLMGCAMTVGSAIGRVESAQFVGGCREVGEGTGDRPQVVVEHVPVDVVDGVASLVVAAVIDLAGRPPQASACLRRLLFPSPFSAPPTGMPASMNGDSSSPTNSMISGAVTPVLVSWSASTRPIVAEPAGPAVSGSLPSPPWTK